ncbi:unnamed protein product, partial [Laminaria digitata]
HHHAGDTGRAVAVGDGAVRELWAFLVKGLALDLLGAHFKGIGSALACINPGLLARLHYPYNTQVNTPPGVIFRADFVQNKGGTQNENGGCGKISSRYFHRRIARRLRSPRWPSWAPLFEAFTTALPSLLAWGMAVWGAGQLRWGLASGLSVGLFVACLSLKAASFAQACVPFKAAAGIDGQRSKLDGAHQGGNPLIDNPTPTPTPDPAPSNPSSAQETQLTFGEFLFFLLAAPSLVCEPRFLKVSARHPACVTRAFSEFFHAGLTFLALHAACSALVAPTFRVLAAASAYSFQEGSQECSQEFSASCDAEGAGLGEESSEWVDVAGWAALKAGGSGGWFHDFLPGGGDDEPVLGGGGDSCGSGTMLAAAAGWVETVAALAWGMFVFSPLVHFGTFYGFWHCVCLGCAELWGYPDRNLYGEINMEALRI